LPLDGLVKAVETRTCVEKAKATGKAFAGWPNIISGQTPPANIDAMFETLAECR